MSDDYAKVCDALHAISPNVDRETWVQLAMAVKATLGEAGFAAWDDWSRGGDTYNSKSARGVWRSVRASGGIGPGTLFKLAQDHGWRGEPIVYDAAQEAARRAARAAEQAREDERKQRAAKRAEGNADALVKRAKFDGHAYLQRKGFPKERGLCTHVDAAGWQSLGFRSDPPAHPNVLVVPMRDYATNALRSAQLIHVDGTKTFLPGGAARGCCHRLSSGTETYIAEGLATALSVLEALRSMFVQATVLVAFSAGNVPELTRQVQGRCFVIADNDPPKKDGSEGAGSFFAKKAGRPFWQPPEVGTDANDFHQAHGLAALADALRRLRMT